MKHSKQVLFIFLGLFLLSQAIGLFLISRGADVIEVIDEESQKSSVEVVFTNTTMGERPQIQGSQTLISIIIGIFFGTLFLLLLSKFNKVNIWKHWFFFASLITMSVSFGVIFNSLIAWVLAVVLAAWKVYRSNFLIHNLTELFIYPGIALLLVPLLNVFYAFMLLVLISIYDAYAVWKSKHMITMAKFAKNANLFPGLSLSYDSKTGNVLNQKNISSSKKSSNSKFKKSNVKTGILGGGDIAFPLIFSSVFFVFLLEQGFSTSIALLYSFIISFFAGISLLLLFLYSKKDKYYPAMPFISAGCFIGYLFVILLINIF